MKIPRGNSARIGKRIQPEILCCEKLIFRRNTLCISREIGAFTVQKIGCSPQTILGELPPKTKG